MPSTSYKKDHALIEACVQGVSGSWNEFVGEYDRLMQSIVYGFQRQLSRFGLDAEDLKGHIYEKLLENGCKRMLAWKGHAKFSTYLVMVVRNLSLDFLAKHTKGPVAERFDVIPEPGDEAMPIAEIDLTEHQMAALQTTLGELPDRQVLILRLRLEGKSLREIALTQKIHLGTVSVENSRAMKMLRTKLRLRHPELWEEEVH